MSSTPPLEGKNRDPYPEALWTHPEPDVDRTIHLGDAYGVKDGDDITPALRSTLDDRTEILVPEGSYTLDRSVLQGHYTDLALRAEPSADLWGVEMDYGTRDDTVLDFDAADGTLLVENIVFRGTLDGCANARWRCDAHTPSSEVVLKHVRLVDGEDCNPDIDSGTQGWYVGSDGNHAGTLRLLWCEASGFMDNGTYVDGYSGEGRGQCIVVGGYYENNNIANVRLGTDHSTAYRVTVVVDDPSQDTGVTKNFRGIRVRRPTETDSTSDNAILIDDCDLYHTSDTPATASIALAKYLNPDSSGLVRNCRIRNDSDDMYAVIDQSPPGTDWEFEELHITGSGDTRAIGVPSSAVVDDPEEPDLDPWWGEDVRATEEESDDSGLPADLPDSWRRLYDSVVDSFGARDRGLET